MLPKMKNTANRISYITMVESSPEKAGVGGSIPSLATMFSITYKPPNPQFRSISFQFQARQNSLMEQSCGRTIVPPGSPLSGPAFFLPNDGTPDGPPLNGI